MFGQINWNNLEGWVHNHPANRGLYDRDLDESEPSQDDYNMLGYFTGQSSLGDRPRLMSGTGDVNVVSHYILGPDRVLRRFKNGERDGVIVARVSDACYS